MSLLRSAPTPRANPAHDKTVAILHAKGYNRLRSFQANDCPRGAKPCEVGFEVWAGPKGTLIVQQWTEGNGAAVYASWPLGHTFEALEAAL